MKNRNKTVGRLELIDRIHQNQKILRQDEVKTGVDVVFNALTQFMAKNDRIEIRGFGSFTLRKRAERIGRNPRTGEIKLIATRHTPHFKVSRSLGKAIESVEPVVAPVKNDRSSEVKKSRSGQS